MTRQSEAALEENLIKQLEDLGHKQVQIKDEKDLLSNLKSQLEKQNKLSLTDNEFKKVLNHLDKGSVFERAKILRDRMHIAGDDGTSKYIEFINMEHWCQNQFQVTSQVTIEGSYKNRYDVTLLVNGLPLVQIELKRRGLELKEAFNQTNRYQRHSYGAGVGLFQYLQIFVISNGVNTKYYANNRKQSFEQTFYWSDIENKVITNLDEFASVFLEPCHMAKMITKYIVLNETQKILMVLRPYQYFAVERIIDRVKETNKNGYIWHTTGSGKTLTSFKAAQILKNIPKVYKVVFVVDRKDLDYQTTKEFNAFSKGSVDGTDNTRELVKQLEGDTKLIVTTIQKLNTAISRERYLKKVEHLKDKRIVFIFDECHRSQFGETHGRIVKFFEKAQMFGFTGTPIFADNAVKNALGKRTTKELFSDCLHKYVITDAIKDGNVLKFSIEYVGRYKEKVGSKTAIDIEVEDIDTKELLEDEKRLEKITNYILAHHNRKTHSKDFTAMFCVAGVDVLIKYYELFRNKKEAGEHDLKIATIFSFTANEDDKDADGLMDSDIGLEVSAATKINKHSRDRLEEYIGDYNREFGCNYTTTDSKSFYNYYNNIAKRVKEREIDILLVVNMFLTGFDSKTLNTLYVDKNLKYHGLIQAYSRTNRILNERKSQGNIISFRNLKSATDDAIALFSNKEAKETIFMEPYEDLVQRFNAALEELLKIAPSVDSVNELEDELMELEFIKAFRELMRIKNQVGVYADFSFEDLDMEEQEFEDYKSKYLDLYDKVKRGGEKEKVSILNDVDFEIELLHRDEVNVRYILQLLAGLKEEETEDAKEKRKKHISDIISGAAELRSKKELIEKFIEGSLLKLKDASDVEDAFEKFWDIEQRNAFNNLCTEEKLEPGKFESLLDDYLFTNRLPQRNQIVDALEFSPKIFERGPIIERVTGKLEDFVETFITGFDK